MPFAVRSITGLALTTAAVHVATDATAGWSRAAATVAVVIAILGAFGIVWIAQSVILDQVLFRDRPVRLAVRKNGPLGAGPPA
jgi:hypothetical protein